MESIFLLLAVVAIGVFLVYLALSEDRERIREHLEQESCQLLSMNYLPFGGWSDRGNYTVRFLDRAGNEHETTCRTGMWIGVYFTRDRIVREAMPSETLPVPSTATAQEPLLQELEAENRRLREELEKLRGTAPAADGRDR